jgi:hypothetical protein
LHRERLPQYQYRPCGLLIDDALPGVPTLSRRTRGGAIGRVRRPAKEDQPVVRVDLECETLTRCWSVVPVPGIVEPGPEVVFDINL